MRFETHTLYIYAKEPNTALYKCTLLFTQMLIGIEYWPYQLSISPVAFMEPTGKHSRKKIQWVTKTITIYFYVSLTIT